MKIIYLVHQFYPEYQTGTEKFVLNSALMAQKFGNKVKIITYSFYDDAFYEQEENGILIKEFFFKGIPVLAFKYKKTPINLNIDLHNDLLYGVAKKIFKREAPDIIHVGHLMRVHEFVWVAKEAKIPYVITLTDFFLLCPKVNLSPNMFSLCSGPNQGKMCDALCGEINNAYIVNRLSESRELIMNSKRVVSPSYFVAKIFKQELNHLHVDVINHGVQYEYIKPNNKVYSPHEKVSFGYAGNLIYHKGVHVLLKAFREIQSDRVELNIFGFGQQAFVKQLKNLVRGDKRVIFKGRFTADELGDVFANIDVLVTPSLCYETYSMVLHEALASNVPVIASDLGAMGDEIKENFNGYTFKAGDVDDLRMNMEKFVYDANILNEMKQNIRKEMLLSTIEQEAYNYLKVYNSIYDTL